MEPGYWPDLKIEHPLVHDPLEPLCPKEGIYRHNIGCLVIKPSSQGWLLLLGERRDTPGPWQWPQGGCEDDEQPQATLARELMEEVGLSSYRVVYQFPFLVRYNFPAALGARFAPRVGQEQWFFVVELKGQEPCLQRATDQEFSRLRWAPIDSVVETAIWFKKPLYQYVIEHLQHVLKTR